LTAGRESFVHALFDADGVIREEDRMHVEAEGVEACPQWTHLSIKLSINSRPTVPLESCPRELESSKAQVVYSCRVK
jgi:hypothetical protein